MFCFYYRYLIHHKIDQLEKHKNPALSRHLEHCAACREYDNRMIRLGAYLKESACGQLSDTALQQIETSVLKSPASSFTAARRPSSRTRLWIPCTAAAGFVLITGLSGWLYWTHQCNIKAMTAARDAIASLNKVANFGDSVSLFNLLTEQSALREMNQLSNNAQQAVIYITNCIPQGSSNRDMISSEIPGN